jgi:hypothetical protein
MIQTTTFRTRMLRSFAGVYASLPFKGIERPVFILGCGRSGTTILGEALAHHPRVTYLNEPRRLWYACYPQTDIWTDLAGERGGKVVLAAPDAEPGRSQRLRRRFYFETLKTGRPVLIEKLPINSFRLPFIHAIFPDARYVHIGRNGVEVARSVEKMGPQWWGAAGYKWKQLCAVAAARAETADLPAACQTDYDRGLLEWRLSTSFAREFLSGLPKAAYCELTYDDFTERPLETIAEILSFLGLPSSDQVNRFVSENVSRRSGKATLENLSQSEMRIGGEMLAASSSSPVLSGGRR